MLRSRWVYINFSQRVVRCGNIHLAVEDCDCESRREIIVDIR